MLPCTQATMSMNDPLPCLRCLVDTHGPQEGVVSHKGCWVTSGDGERNADVVDVFREMSDHVLQK